MKLKLGYQALLAEANTQVDAIPRDEAARLVDDPDVLFVDICDVRELQRDGMIPGAFHAPRGMLEFWVDPDSPYHKDVFASGRHFILYCASAWRPALATAQLARMGLPRVSHLEEGFSAWKKAQLPVAYLQGK